jgi:hypothetical protein
MLDRHPAAGTLIIADQGRHRCTAVIRPLHLRFEASTAAMHLHSESVRTAVLGKTKSRGSRVFTPMHQINIRAPEGRLDPAFMQQLDQTFRANGKSAGGRGLTAHLLDQRIVTATPAHRALCPKAVRHPLEHGQVVVIQTAHQSRIDDIRHIVGTENLTHLIEMTP